MGGNPGEMGETNHPQMLGIEVESSKYFKDIIRYYFGNIIYRQKSKGFLKSPKNVYVSWGSFWAGNINLVAK